MHFILDWYEELALFMIHFYMSKQKRNFEKRVFMCSCKRGYCYYAAPCCGAPPSLLRHESHSTAVHLQHSIVLTCIVNPTIFLH